MGVFETGVGPSTPLFLSFWYQREELATRVAIYFGSSSVAGAFSGAIAYGVLSTMEGAHGIAGWRYNNARLNKLVLFTDIFLFQMVVYCRSHSNHCSWFFEFYRAS